MIEIKRYYQFRADMPKLSIICSENELEEIDGVVVEEAFVDGDAEVPQVDHLG